MNLHWMLQIEVNFDTGLNIKLKSSVIKGVLLREVYQVRYLQR